MQDIVQLFIGKMPSYKIAIMLLKVLHILFTNDIRAVLYFPFLCYADLGLRRMRASLSKHSKPFSFFEGTNFGSHLRYVASAKDQLRSSIEEHMKYICLCRNEG
jgi:hypothetical protein